RLHMIRIELDRLAKALGSLPFLVEREQNVAEVETAKGIGPADLQGLTVSGGSFVKLARLLEIAASLPPALGGAAIGIGVNHHRGGIAGKIKLQLAAWIR